MPAAYAWQLLKKGLFFILAAAVLGAVLAAVALATQQTYSASAHMLLRATTEQQALRAAEPERFFQTQAQRVLGDEILGAAARSLNDGTTATDLRGSVTLDGGTIDDILQITGSGDAAEQSLARVRAVVQAVDAADNPEVVTELLWIGEPQSSLSGVRLIVGGLVGGALLGGVLVLLRGLARRPILDSRLVGMQGADVDVYPLYTNRDDVNASCRRLLDWVDWSRGSLEASGSVATVGVIDLAGTSHTKRVVEALTDPAQAGARRLQVLNLNAETDGDRRPAGASPGQPSSGAVLEKVEVVNGRRMPLSTLLLVGEKGRTSEPAVEEQVRWFTGVAHRSILVLADRKNGRKH